MSGSYVESPPGSPRIESKHGDLRNREFVDQTNNLKVTGRHKPRAPPCIAVTSHLSLTSVRLLVNCDTAATSAER